jgi:hypothetical protein
MGLGHTLTLEQVRGRVFRGDVLPRHTGSQAQARIVALRSQRRIIEDVLLLRGRWIF